MMTLEIVGTEQSFIKESDCHKQKVDSNNNCIASTPPLITNNINNYQNLQQKLLQQQEQQQQEEWILKQDCVESPPTPTLVITHNPPSLLVSTYGNSITEPVIVFPGTGSHSSTADAMPTDGHALPEHNGQPSISTDEIVDVDVNVNAEEEAPVTPTPQDPSNQEGPRVVTGEKLLLFIIFIAVILSATLFTIQHLHPVGPQWNQVGSTLTGSYNSDNFGRVVALSKHGTIMAVAALASDSQFPYGSNPWVAGYVQAFQYINNDWTPLGIPIQVGDTGDTSGISMDLSKNGKFIAIGTENINENESANVGIVTAGSMKVNWCNGYAWEQLGQELIVGKPNNFYSGDHIKAIAISGNGLIVAGAGMASLSSFSNVSSSVYVFQLQDTIWSPMGNAILGIITDTTCTGISVDLTYDGLTLAVGTLSLESGGTVKVYQYQYKSSDWEAIGQPLHNELMNYGFSCGNFGKSVSLSENGFILAVGTPSYHNGNVQVYQLINDVWTRMGSPIFGQKESEWFGGAVDLSTDGLILAIGGTYKETIQVYQCIDFMWQQVGQDFEGGTAAISGDGNLVAGGMSSKSGTDQPGQVRMYALNNTLFNLAL